MKTLLLLPLLFILGHYSSAQKFSTAVEYNDYIVELQNQIGNKILTFNDEMASEYATLESVLPFYNDLVLTTKNCLEKVEKLEPFERDASLKPAAVNLFTFYVRCFSTSYNEMVHIVFKPELTEADFAKLNEIMENISAEEAGFDAAFTEAQTRFAEKYSFSLERNQLQDQIDE